MAPFRTAQWPTPRLVSDTVSQLLDSLKLRRASVASALSGHAVIVKRLSLPSMSAGGTDRSDSLGG